MIYVLKQIRWYLKGTEFDAITGRPVLKHLLTKRDLRRREAIWIEFLGQFEIKNIIFWP